MGAFFYRIRTLLYGCNNSNKTLSHNGSGEVLHEGQSTSFLILIPAHNEEETIQSTIASIKKSEYDAQYFNILVIADNCTDGTAKLCREGGVAVFERQDLARKSKGHALADVINHILTSSKDSKYSEAEAIVIIDADTKIDSHLLSLFSNRIKSGQDWMQAYYTVSNPDESWRSKLMTYTFSLFNGIWEMGLDALKLGTALRGNGMCFSKRGLLRQPWSASGLAEDLEFSWRLRLQSEFVHFVYDGRVYGEMTGSAEASKSQRKRWEAGRKALRSIFSKNLVNAKMSKWKKILLFVDLYYLPLSELGLLFLGGTVVVSCNAFFNNIPQFYKDIYFGFYAVFACCFIVYLLCPFVLLRLPISYLKCFAVVPYYVFWKLAMSLGAKPATWVRTERDRKTREKK